MQWIKLSERKPEEGWKGIVKWTDDAAYACFVNGRFINGNICQYGEKFDGQPEMWLDEVGLEKVISDTWDACWDKTGDGWNGEIVPLGYMNTVDEGSYEEQKQEYINSILK